jgi:hypothetical protein
MVKINSINKRINDQDIPIMHFTNKTKNHLGGVTAKNAFTETSGQPQLEDSEK